METQDNDQTTTQQTGPIENDPPRKRGSWTIFRGRKVHSSLSEEELKEIERKEAYEAAARMHQDHLRRQQRQQRVKNWWRNTFGGNPDRSSPTQASEPT